MSYSFPSADTTAYHGDLVVSITRRLLRMECEGDVLRGVSFWDELRRAGLPSPPSSVGLTAGYIRTRVRGGSLRTPRGWHQGDDSGQETLPDAPPPNRRTILGKVRRRSHHHHHHKHHRPELYRNGEHTVRSRHRERRRCRRLDPCPSAGIGRRRPNLRIQVQGGPRVQCL